MKFTFAILSLSWVVWSTAASYLPSELPVNPGGIGGLFKGPNSETIIQGPDGSVITAAAEGGVVLVDSKLEEPIVVPEPEVNLVATQQAVPVISETIPVAPVVAQTVAVETPVVVEVEKEQSSDLVGPSGRISTRGDDAIIAGPASTTIKDRGIVAKGPPILGRPGPVLVETASPSLVLAPELVPASIPVSSLPPITSIPVVAQSRGIYQGPIVSSSIAPALEINQGSGLSSTISGIYQRPTLSSTLGPSIDLGQGQLIPESVGINQGLILSSLEETERRPIVSTTPSSLEINNQIDFGIQALDQASYAAVPAANIIPPDIPVIRGKYSASIPANINGLSGFGNANTLQPVNYQPVSFSPVQGDLRGPQSVVLSSSSLGRSRPISISSTIVPDITPNGIDRNSVSVNPSIVDQPSIDYASLPSVLNWQRNQQPQNVYLSDIPRGEVTLGANIQGAPEGSRWVSSTLSPALLTETRTIQPQLRTDPNLYSNIQVSEAVGLPNQDIRRLQAVGPRYDYVSRNDPAGLNLAALQEQDLAGNNAQVRFYNARDSSLPIGINDGLTAEAWGRNQRDTKGKTYTEKKV